MSKVYYEQDNIIVRTSHKSDVLYLKDRLRKSDIAEIWASNHHSPEEALKLSLEKSIFCCTVQNGHPLAMFGINPHTVLGKKATIWMLSVPELDRIRFRFARHTKYFIRHMLSFYPYLDNYVHIKNKDSIRWLKMAGATINGAAPYGVDQEMFHYFYFNK